MLNPSLPITIDMHAHLSDTAPEELAIREEHGIYTVFSCGTPEEAGRLKAFADIYRRAPGQGGRPSRGEGEVPFAMSCGVHPWDSDRVKSADLTDYYAGAMAIGEIGMDRVWCDVPLATQEAVFREQLMAAAYFRKPIVLHTKGCEAEILDMIQDFPGKILVHWYSGPADILAGYVELGCYFTVGPDRSPGITDIPLDRLFVETDGADALDWLARHGRALPGVAAASAADLGKREGVLLAGRKTTELPPPTLMAIPRYLAANMQYVADAKGVYLEDLHRRMVDNLRAFITPE